MTLLTHQTELDVLIFIKVRKKAKTRDGYNQVPHLAKDTTWKITKTQENIIYTRAKESASSFPRGDLKATRNKHGRMTKTNAKY